MEPPVCKVCHKPHWPREPHKYADKVVEPVAVRKVVWPTPAAARCARPVLCAECVKKDAEIGRLSALVIERDTDRVRLTAEVERLRAELEAARGPVQKFDKKAYQRELMRKRRAEAKAELARRKEGK